MAVRRTAAETRVVKQMEKIAFGGQEAWPDGPPNVGERIKALEWLGKHYRMDPAERHRQEMESRKQELAERKQEAEENLARAQARSKEAKVRKEAVRRVRVEVVGAPQHIPKKVGGNG